MTRKHFETIAAALKAARPEHIPSDPFARSPYEAGAWDAWSSTVYEVTDALRGSNPAFDHSRFQTACGLFSAF